MNSSYDEKMRKKSPAEIGDFFLCALPTCPRCTHKKPQNLPQTLPRKSRTATQYYRTPTTAFQIAAIPYDFTGRLSARAARAHGTTGNVLFS
jgi:hypothetical protein